MTLYGKLIQLVGRLLHRDYGPELFNGNAMSYIAPEARAWCRGRGIDFGAGRWPFADSAPIDLDTTLQLGNVRSESQDYVFSSHTLEHTRGWRGTLAEFRRVLKPGGVLFLYLPHECMTLWNAETPWGRSAGHVWTPRIETLLGYAQLYDWDVVNYDTMPDTYQSWFIILGRPE